MSDQDEACIPERLLEAPEMIPACQEHDFAAIFSLVKRAGIYPAQIAKLCDMTPSRVGEIKQGKRTLTQMAVIERIADGLRIPGRMLRLADRPWESAGQPDPSSKNDSPTGVIGFEFPRPPVLDGEALALKRELEAAKKADASVAKLFAGQVDMIRQLDRRLGTEPLLPQLRSQIEQIARGLGRVVASGTESPMWCGGEEAVAWWLGGAVSRRCRGGQLPPRRGHGTGRRRHARRPPCVIPMPGRRRGYLMRQRCGGRLPCRTRYGT